jgi:hypothetical protein
MKPKEILMWEAPTLFFRRVKGGGGENHYAVCPPVPFELLNQLTDIHKTGYELDATQSYI